MAGAVTLCFLFASTITNIIYLWGDNMLVHRERISNSVDKELYRKLKELSDMTRVPISKYLDEAIQDLLEKYNTNKR
jgi:hypothetical protein